MQGRRFLRGTTLVYALVRKRAFIFADNGAARRRLNVLAPACSGAMFPRLSTAAFHLPRLSLGVPAGYSSLPRMHVLSYGLAPKLSSPNSLFQPAHEIGQAGALAAACLRHSDFQRILHGILPPVLRFFPDSPSGTRPPHRRRSRCAGCIAGFHPPARKPRSPAASRRPPAGPWPWPCHPRRFAASPENPPSRACGPIAASNPRCRCLPPRRTTRRPG